MAWRIDSLTKLTTKHVTELQCFEIWEWWDRGLFNHIHGAFLPKHRRSVPRCPAVHVYWTRIFETNLALYLIFLFSTCHLHVSLSHPRPSLCRPKPRPLPPVPPHLPSHPVEVKESEVCLLLGQCQAGVPSHHGEPVRGGWVGVYHQAGPPFLSLTSAIPLSSFLLLFLYTISVIPSLPSLSLSFSLSLTLSPPSFSLSLLSLFPPTTLVFSLPSVPSFPLPLSSFLFTHSFTFLPPSLPLLPPCLFSLPPSLNRWG